MLPLICKKSLQKKFLYFNNVANVRKRKENETFEVVTARERGIGTVGPHKKDI